MIDELFDNRFAAVILYGTALAMGISIIVFTMFGIAGIGYLVGIGLLCLGIGGLEGVEKDDKPKKRKR